MNSFGFIDRFHSMKCLVLSFMDEFSEYNQIRMALRDAEKTAFRTPIGNFYYTVLPFGLKHMCNLSTSNDDHIS